MIKMYNDDNEVRGYQINNKFLLKHYAWGNKTEWIIANEDLGHIQTYEITKLYDEGKIEFVDCFKEGKQRIIELNNERKENK